MKRKKSYNIPAHTHTYSIEIYCKAISHILIKWAENAYILLYALNPTTFIWWMPFNEYFLVYTRVHTYVYTLLYACFNSNIHDLLYRISIIVVVVVAMWCGIHYQFCTLKLAMSLDVNSYGEDGKNHEHNCGRKLSRQEEKKNYDYVQYDMRRND